MKTVKISTLLCQMKLKELFSIERQKVDKNKNTYYSSKTTDEARQQKTHFKK